MIEWIKLGGLVVPPGVSVSFQRFALSASGRMTDVPPSLGALPVGLHPAGDFLVPLAENEGFWIGVEPVVADLIADLALTAEFTDGSTRDVISGADGAGTAGATLTVSGVSVIGGIPHPDGGFTALARVSATDGDRACRALLFSVRRRGAAPLLLTSSCFRIRLVDYDAFCAGSGRSAPPLLDLGAGYRGFRLP